MIARVHLRPILDPNSKSCGIMPAYRPTGRLPRRGPLFPGVYEWQTESKLSKAAIKGFASTAGLIGAFEGSVVQCSKVEGELAVEVEEP